MLAIQRARCIADNIDTARNLERELVIRQADVLLQVRERERRRSPLRVDGDETPDGERRRIDREDQPIVVRLLGFWYELQRPAAGGQARRANRRKTGVNSLVRRPFPARNSAGVVAVGVRRDGADNDLFVRGNIEIDLRPVRDEQLLLGRRVIPPHLARLLDQHRAALGQLLLQDAALIRVHEVGGKIFDCVVLALQRLGELRRCRIRGAAVGDEQRRARRSAPVLQYADMDQR